MDSLRGHLSDHGNTELSANDREPNDDDTGREPPPAAIGQDERRMQVRAYNHWASLLGDRNFPLIADLNPADLPDFGPYSVLLDFSDGIENPAISYLGEALAQECGAEGAVRKLGDVPSRSLLSRITDHYMQILANQAPIGFEAEFVNQRGATILYRGILLPYSSDDDTIHYIYGVINWKELADQQTTDELLLEIDQALESMPGTPRLNGPLTEWADGPVRDAGILDLVNPLEPDNDSIDWPEPAPGEAGDDTPSGTSPREPADLPPGTQSAEPGMKLTDWLASAREMAQTAILSEERSHRALYAAIGKAYDFSIQAIAAPAEFAALVEDAGLTMQDRAPMTPVVKLVFGTVYDKTRLTEYAAALSHAHRLNLAPGTLADFLADAEGGLKGVVSAERRLRREESGITVEVRTKPREALVRRLRDLEPCGLSEIPGEGSEFTLLLARRLPGGEIVLLGEVANDAPLLERAARRLLD